MFPKLTQTITNVLAKAINIQGNVTINGKTYAGRGGDVVIHGNGDVYINGEKQEQQVVGQVDITINGHVETAESVSGDLTIHGNVTNAKTVSGDIQVKNGFITNAKTVSGDIST